MGKELLKRKSEDMKTVCVFHLRFITLKCHPSYSDISFNVLSSVGT